MTERGTTREGEPTEPQRGAALDAIPGSAKRLAEGWQRRFVVDSSRLVEMTRLYQSLGYETVADPVRPEDLSGEASPGTADPPPDGADSRCQDCRLVIMRWLHVLYTRPARAARGD